MKYLPDEHLTRIYKKQKPQKLKRKQGELHDILESKPNFSFASLQYMKKYNLLPSSGNKRFYYYLQIQRSTLDLSEGKITSILLKIQY